MQLHRRDHVDSRTPDKLDGQVVQTAGGRYFSCCSERKGARCDVRSNTWGEQHLPFSTRPAPNPIRHKEQATILRGRPGCGIEWQRRDESEVHGGSKCARHRINDQQPAITCGYCLLAAIPDGADGSCACTCSRTRSHAAWYHRYSHARTHGCSIRQCFALLPIHNPSALTSPRKRHY